MPYVCVPQVNKETTKQYRPLPAMFWPAFEQYSGLTSHKATCSIRSLETKLHSLWVKWLLADMLVFEILQNDGLLCAHSLSLYLPCLFFLSLSMLYTSTRYIHTLLCVHLLSLMCQRLLVMRFLQDGKLQGHWLTAHFKHCSLPLPFLSCGTQRMKREWEEE